jgi:hypothetical protein
MKKLYAVLTAICMAVLVSCFSPWEGGEGTIRFSIYPVSAAIAPFNADITSYQIILTGPGGVTQTHYAEGSGTVRIAVTPGEWNVAVRATGAPPFGHDDIFPAETLRALGFADEPVTVRAGQSVQAMVTMTTALEISTHYQLAALGDILGDLDVSEAILFLTSNITAEGEYAITGDITLISEEDFSITRGADHDLALFFIHNGGRLTLGKPDMGGSITIDGGHSAGILAYRSLITISSSGTFVMHDGITLTGNNNSSGQGTNGHGGAVFVGSDTRFYMHGGTISNNYSVFGGGVAVYGHFIMSGGSIFDNLRDVSGAAVHVWFPGTATIFGQPMTTAYIDHNLP